jgi:hypothetical protein
VTPAIDLPAAARIPMVVAGTFLVLQGVRLGFRRPGPEPAVGPSQLAGRVLLAAGRLARGVPLLRRADDRMSTATSIAVAPECWPARWVAAGLAAWRARPADGPPPPLADLVSGLRLLSAAVWAATVAGCAALLAGGAAGTLLGLTVGLALGAFLPDAVLAAAVRRERRAGEKDAAAAVDLLAATASAGLSLPEAMVLTAAHAPPAIAAVLRAAAVRRAMGEDPRAALAGEAARFGIPVLGDVAQAVERQRRLGVPLGPELRQIATRLRADQRARTLERAARRGPVGTLLVALLIAPLCLAAVIACLVGGLVEGGGLGLR